MRNSSIDIRESMISLPKNLQTFLTWLTAKPHSGDGYSANRTTLHHLITACLSMFLGLFFSTIILTNKGIYLAAIPISLLLSVSGIRKLQVVIYHHCSHNNIFSNKRANYILGEVISIILLIKDFKTYRYDHMLHHNAKGLLTHLDETVQDLSMVGLMPGLDKKTLYRNMLLSFVSPFSQLRSLLNRISSSLLSPYWRHNVIATFYWYVLISLVNHYNVWLEFSIAWLIPLTFLYHISRTLRLIVEHTWPNDTYLDNRNLDFICVSTVAVFLGEPYPSKTNSIIKNIVASLKWTSKMLTIHLIPRVFVLVGDTPCHDHHHRHPSSKDWPNYIYARQKDSEKPNVNRIPYKEIWGFLKAIDTNLDAMSKTKTQRI